MSASTLAPWLQQQLTGLLLQRGHARLLAGPSGLGQYSLALSLARAWLCDQPHPQGGCGHCASCHAIDVRAHADLCVLMPETDMLDLGWPLPEKAQSDIDDKKRKASKEIRVDAMRDAVEFAQRTSGRGRGKVVLIFPAERMNHITANALLKTLEEPAGDVRFVLASEAAHQLLPTIRSRCQVHNMLWPSFDEALAWLKQAGVAADVAPTLLRAAGGRPEDALRHAHAGLDARMWAAFPKAASRGEVAAVKDWPAPVLVDALQKVCHDLMVRTTGGRPRFFEVQDLPASPSMAALAGWARALSRTMQTVEHPYSAGLMTEALMSQAQAAIHPHTGQRT
ncbi:MAG: putative polymerase delta prime subunit [Pseudomonadota bacterium]|jgi:DNA polymerase-3 subunit delta'